MLIYNSNLKCIDSLKLFNCSKNEDLEGEILHRRTSLLFALLGYLVHNTQPGRELKVVNWS